MKILQTVFTKNVVLSTLFIFAGWTVTLLFFCVLTPHATLEKNLYVIFGWMWFSCSVLLAEVWRHGKPTPDNMAKSFLEETAYNRVFVIIFLVGGITGIRQRFLKDDPASAHIIAIITMSFLVGLVVLGSTNYYLRRAKWSRAAYRWYYGSSVFKQRLM